MKKIIFLILHFCFMSACAFAQSVNGIPLAQLDSEYIIIKNLYKDFDREISRGRMGQGRLVVEFGNGVFSTNAIKHNEEEAEIRTSKGDPLKFNSATHALSFLDNHGFSLIDLNITPFGEASLMYTFMLARKLEPEEE